MTTKLDLQFLPTAKIRPPKIEMRTDYNEEQLHQLADSIRQHGLIHPVHVCPRGKEWEIITGERRRRACILLDWTEIPAFVTEATADVLEGIKMHENLIRSNVSAFDEASYLESLMKAHDLSQAALAASINRSPAYVSERLAMLNYPDDLAAAVRENVIPVSAARELVKIRDKTTREAYIGHAIAGGINERTAADWRRTANAADAVAAATDEPAETTAPALNATPQGYQCTACQQYHPLPDTVMIRLCNGCWSVVQESDLTAK